ncbi:MAG: hypothetical protein LBF54_02130 [Holosporaceae bacterium]|jgi:hypothetical protein|nr:hypothetical protein [Holosporaceae bacterium]
MGKHNVFRALFSSFVIALCFPDEASCATGSSSDRNKSLTRTIKRFFTQKPDIRGGGSNPSSSEESAEESKDFPKNSPSSQDDEGESQNNPQNFSDEHSADAAPSGEEEDGDSPSSRFKKNLRFWKAQNPSDSEIEELEKLKTEFRKRFGGKIKKPTIDDICASRDGATLCSRFDHIISSLEVNEKVNDILTDSFIRQQNLTKNGKKLAAFIESIQELVDKLPQPTQVLPEETEEEDEPSSSSNDSDRQSNPTNPSDEHSADAAPSGEEEDSPSSKIEEAKAELKRRFGGKIKKTIIDDICASSDEKTFLSRLYHIIGFLEANKKVNDILTDSFIRQQSLTKNRKKLAAFAKLMRKLATDKLSQPEETEKEDEPDGREKKISGKIREEPKDEPLSSLWDQLEELKTKLRELRKSCQMVGDKIEKVQAYGGEKEAQIP